MNVFVLLNTKEDILNNVGNTVFFLLLWKLMLPQNSLITNFLQNIFICVQQKREYVCVCVCVRTRETVCVCERERESVCERERECVCERERECVCVCACQKSLGY